MEEMIVRYGFVLLFFCIFLDDITLIIKVHRYKGRTQGEVIDITEEYYRNKQSKKMSKYFPTYRYEVDGVVYEKKFQYGKNSPDDLPIGSIVPLRYKEKNPNKFIAMENETIWYKNIMISVIFLVIVIFVFVIFPEYILVR